MIKNKRGAGLTDLFVFMVVAFALAIICALFLYIGTTTYNNFLSHSEGFDKALEGTGMSSADVIGDTFGQVPNAYQSLKWITVMLIVGMAISILISSFLVNTHPVFFVAYLFIWIIAIIVAVPMSNAYEIIYQNKALSSTFAGFWGQTYIFLNLHIWITVIGGFAGILMFINMVRSRDEGLS